MNKDKFEFECPHCTKRVKSEQGLKQHMYTGSCKLRRERWEQSLYYGYPLL